MCRRVFFQRQPVMPDWQSDDEEGSDSDGEFFEENRDPDRDDMFDLFNNHPHDNRQNRDRPEDNRPNVPNNSPVVNNEQGADQNAPLVGPGEIDWPENIEPFDPRSFDPNINGHDLPSLIEEFDAYLVAISTHGFHPLIDLRPGSHETHIEVPALILSTLACISRLASNPNLNTQSPDDVHIHGMCRNEWTVVVQRLQQVLPLIAQREMARRAILWPGPSASDLYLELRFELFHFPRLHTVENPAQRNALERNVEVMRFRRDADCMVRWIVTQAAIEYRVNSAGEGDARFHPEDWWVGLMGSIL